MEIYYVNYLDAIFLIQEVVIDFSYRKKLEEYLKRSCEPHRKHQLLDGHFILRLLLEYYHFKKGEIFAELSKAFSQYLREFNRSMSFEAYLKIFDYNTFELTLSEKVEIYEKAFSLGRGVVDL